MSTSTDLLNDDFPKELTNPTEPLERVEVPPPSSGHPSESDTFAREQAVPGNDQHSLATARILLVGAGGLNSWTALGLARSGATSLVIVEPDGVERSNLHRQFYFDRDRGQLKAFRLAHNLAPHLVAGGEIVGIALPFPQALDSYDMAADLILAGVDNNKCRLAAVLEARKRCIPAVFTMLSLDGMRCQCFLQGPKPEDPCLWCALPNLNPEGGSACAAAVITSCLLASAFTVFFAHRALMGWPANVAPFNWREADLLGVVPDRIGCIAKRPNCAVCG